MRVMCEESGVRFVEAIAAMGKVHPFFEKGGMRRVERGEGKVYFWREGGEGDVAKIAKGQKSTKEEII